MMDWNNLLSEERKRTSSTHSDHRNGFEKDYDRIVPSSSLRRLQDKAQVFPLQKNDFVRTRLTHSLEVSALGRSFGNLIGKKLVEEGKVKIEDFSRKISALLATVCLVHDLGNPSFGHCGETIIQNWFKQWFSKDIFSTYKGIKTLTQEQKNDFIHFEGNAQALRILTRLQFLNDQNGVNFTYGTLASLLKYPHSSSEIDSTKGKSYSKFGYFQAEKKIVGKIKEATGIGEKRHPLTFLMEASDDIAYYAADIEDGVKKSIVRWDEEYKAIKEKLNKKYSKGFKFLDEQRDLAEINKVPDRDLVNVQNFRVWAQGEMFKACADTFMENYDAIMNGEFDKELLEASNANDIKIILEEIAVRLIYPCKEVLTLELVGHSVITGLLNMFIEALVTDEGKYKSKQVTGKYYHLISSNFKYIAKLDIDGKPNKTEQDLTLYDKLLLVTDFISGMTDSYAVDLYQTLSGVKLP
ncbi:deoxyguanosinetriphosphate triphosphohydrolase [Desulfosporosinus fructosivorans]|uniref:Deoxyguanosinetriphosphate triphosphohydrolase n=1 Tax=Desulfosporosinus fructosivorans TaxID=2018669 RepID=A0A4Z0R3Q8_9FIRM|nr:deoxyguanosinetriphosphate triphosphohydrolase [Desulfosporosinus fructosivorans]